MPVTRIGPPGADCLTDARAILKANTLSCERVISVDRDSVLYLNGVGRARTMWLHRPEHGPLRLELEPGFAATPPFDWHAVLPGDKPPPTNHGLAGHSPPR